MPVACQACLGVTPASERPEPGARATDPTRRPSSLGPHHRKEFASADCEEVKPELLGARVFRGLSLAQRPFNRASSGSDALSLRLPTDADASGCRIEGPEAQGIETISGPHRGLNTSRSPRQWGRKANQLTSPLRASGKAMVRSDGIVLMFHSVIHSSPSSIEPRG